MRAAVRVSTKLSSSYDGYYIKFNPALFSWSSNVEDAKAAFHLSLNITHSFTESLILQHKPFFSNPGFFDQKLNALSISHAFNM